jgi:transposase InsO family protein
VTATQAQEIMAELQALLQQPESARDPAAVLQAVAALLQPQVPAGAPAALGVGQTRFARPGDGRAQVFTPGPIGAAAAALPQPFAASVHNGLSSAHSAASATTLRTPIMRHTQLASENDDNEFKVSAERAYKAPELTDSSNYPMWRATMLSWLESWGLAMLVARGPRYMVLPVATEQLVPEERAGIAGYELNLSASAPSGGPIAQSVLELRAGIEFDKCMFAARALLFAVQKVPLAASVAVSIPFPNAHAMWLALEQLFFPQNTAQLFSLEQQVASLRQREDEDVTSYGARSQLLFNQLAMLGSVKSVVQRCTGWILGLLSLSQNRRDLLGIKLDMPHATFEGIVASARQFEQEDVVRGRLLGKQAQQQSAAHMADSAPGASSGRDYSAVTCHSCGKLGHISRHCSKRDAASKNAVCAWCGVRGHQEAQCFKKKGGMPKTAGQEAAKPKQGALAQSNSSAAYPQANLFERVPAAADAAGAVALASEAQRADPFALFDSGANEHVLRDLPSGSDCALSEASGVPIRTAGGQFIHAQQAGDVTLQLSSGHSLRLGGALHHAGVARNLLSVYKLLVQHDAQGVWFTRESAELVARDGSTLLKALQQNGVYALELAHAAAHDAESIAAVATSIQLWHERLNHASATVLNRLIRGRSLAGFDARQPTSIAELNCEACRLGKQPHAAHGSAVPAEHRATFSLERVDWDYLGPIGCASLGGATGALVGVDRSSNYGWVFLLKSREEIQERLLEWCRHMHNKLRRFPATLHFDNAKEFHGARLKSFCSESGIALSYSPVYDPALNGAAERFNRTIVEAATTALLRAGAHKLLWGEALLCVARVYNLVRTNEGDDLRTAEQRLLGSPTPPRVFHLRPFGCTAYVRLESVDVPGKFDAVAAKMVFVGYSDVGKWRFIHPSTVSIVESVHATFAESDFTAMHTLRATLQQTDDAEDEDDEAYFGRVTLRNEIELVKRYSLQSVPPHSPAAPASSAAAEPAAGNAPVEHHPLPAGLVPAAGRDRRQRVKGAAPSRSSARVAAGVGTQPPVKLGMVSPGDLGQAVLTEVCALEAAAQQEQLQLPTDGSSLPSDPRSWREAMARPLQEAQEWRDSFLREENSLIEKGVFTVVDSLPPGVRCLGAKLVFRTKTDGDGRVLSENARKTRLTAMGNEQRAGVDYGETFSSAMSLTSLRLLVRLAAHYGLRIGHIDFSTAYLNADLDRVVYMRAPPGMRTAKPGQFLRLVRALYGLHQSGRLWAELLMKTLIQLGFTPCEHGDPYVLVRVSRSQRMLYIGVYVDDMPYLAHPQDQAEMAQIVEQLGRQFKITVALEVHTLLGMRIVRDEATGAFRMHQQAYVEKVLEQFGMARCNPAHAPEAPSAAAKSQNDAAGEAESEFPSTSAASGGGDRPRVTTANFRALVGALFWISNGTRFDIAHAVNRLARCVENPDAEALALAHRVLRYLSGTRSRGLLYPAGNGGPLILEAFSDSDYAGDESSSKSTSGALLKLGGAPIHWLCKQQSTVSRSSSEAEYVAAGECGRLIIWLRVLLAELGCAQERSTPLHIDNETAIAMTSDDGRQFPRRKHIRVVYHWIREAVQDGFIAPSWVKTELQQADLLTKSLGRVIFQRLCALIDGAAEPAV